MGEHDPYDPPFVLGAVLILRLWGQAQSLRVIHAWSVFYG